MRIDVTEDDIANGVSCFEPRSPLRGRHPIALAIKRATGRDAIVGNRWLTFAFLPPIEMTDEAILFVERFDLGEPVSPFSFDLDLAKGGSVRIPLLGGRAARKRV